MANKYKETLRRQSARYGVPIRSLLTGFAVLALTGCADYLNHYDSMTLAAGDANAYNSMLQTVDPFNPNSHDTHIPGNGARAVAVYRQYVGGGASGAYSGNCPTPDATAADGSNCGGRAASVRPGGALGP